MRQSASEQARQQDHGGERQQGEGKKTGDFKQHCSCALLRVEGVQNSRKKTREQGIDNL